MIIHTSKARGTELTSYEEKTALLLALGWVRANCPTERISICSDSQSLLKAIQSGALDTQAIRKRIDSREGPPSSSEFQVTRAHQATRPLTNWVKAAANATDTPPRPISFVTAKALCYIYSAECKHEPKTCGPPLVSLTDDKKIKKMKLIVHHKARQLNQF